MTHLFGKIQGVSLSDHFCKLLFPTSIGLSHYGVLTPAVPLCVCPWGCKTWFGLSHRVIIQEKSGGWQPAFTEGLLCAGPAHMSSCHFCYLPCAECTVTPIVLRRGPVTERRCGPSWLALMPRRSELQHAGKGRGPGCWHFGVPWIQRVSVFPLKSRAAGIFNSLFKIDFFTSWFPCPCQIWVRLSVGET